MSELKEIERILKERAHFLLNGGFAHITKNGRWIKTDDGDWTGGFCVGILWLLFLLTKEEIWKEKAYKGAMKLSLRSKENTCDLGFLFYPSCVLGYRITKEERLKDVALSSAKTLCALFDEEIGLLCYKGEGLMIPIDIMGNLSLLWWAHKESGEKIYFNVAFQHAKNTIKRFLRSDYSTVHVLRSDGGALKHDTVQGKSPSSCWSRGQAWAIYGFCKAYIFSKYKPFLDTAIGLLKYFLGHLPKDFVPSWDFAEEESDVKDSSAAAIVASAILSLQNELGEDFKDAAYKIIENLCKNYICIEGEGLLKDGCFHFPASIGVRESLIWGDYYFLEALMRKEGKLFSDF